MRHRLHRLARVLRQVDQVDEEAAFAFDQLTFAIRHANLGE